MGARLVVLVLQVLGCALKVRYGLFSLFEEFGDSYILNVLQYVWDTMCELFIVFYHLTNVSHGCSQFG